MPVDKKITAPAFLENPFNTNYGKKALLSYITRPLVFADLPPTHGNIAICRELSQLLSSSGFDLDVVRYSYDKAIDYSRYDMLIGFGNPFEQSFYTGYRGKRIYLATGAYTGQRNPAELFRIRELKARRGIQAVPQRLKNYQDYASSILSDAIICTGNEWTVQTYRPVFNGRIYRVPVIASSFYTKNDFNRDWNDAKRTYLWFGGEGCILKGLDLCIEAFLGLPDYELHICGPGSCEALRIYDNEIRQAGNITYHGFVDVSSDKYKNIMELCGFIIYPSASEAGAGSAIDAMITGLIPLVTAEASIDVGEFGFMLHDTDIVSIKDVIKAASGRSASDLERRSKQCFESSISTFNKDRFRSEVNIALRDVINM